MQAILREPVKQCPRCGAWLEPLRGDCSVCQRSSPESAGRGQSPRREEASPLAFEFELDLDDAPRAPSRPATAATSPVQKPNLGAHGGVRPSPQETGALEFGLDANLDQDPPASARSAVANGASGATAPGSTHGSAPGASVHAPAGSLELLDIPEYEVLALAGYGDAPFGWLPSVPYAFRALQRRRILQQLLARIRTECELTRRAVQGRMPAILEAVKGRFPDDDAVSVVLRPVQDSLGQLSTQSASLENAGERHRSESAALDADLAARQLEKEQLAPGRRTARVLLEDATAQVASAKAELARVNRDCTAAAEAATRAAGTSEFAPPEHARRITELDSQRARATTAVTDADRTVSGRRAELGAMEQRMAQAERAIADVHARRKTLDQRASVERKHGEQAIRSADFQRLDACEGALRRLATAYPDRLIAEETQRFADIELELSRLTREVKRHELAVDSFNGDALRRGLGLVLGAAASLVLLVLLLTRGH